MDTLNPEHSLPTVTPPERGRSVWQIFVPALWGLLLFVVMFVVQNAVIVYFVLRQGAFDLDKMKEVVGDGRNIALAVIMSLPAVLAVAWLATHFARRPFADYLALRWTSWKNYLLATFGLVVLVAGWELLSRVTGHESTPEFMNNVFKTARADGVVWLLAVAFCVAAPILEEVFARGLLYRGWSETILRVPGAIVLSSAAWALMHLQYDWYSLSEVFCLGLWFGYVRYRSGSLWPTIMIHALNNFAALVQTVYLTNQ